MILRCLVWDFDGTLVLSNAIKREGFMVIAAGFAGGVARMEAILASPPGDRHAILAAFAGAVGGDAGDLAARYTAWCDGRILACPERPGADAILRRARHAGLRMHINSATPAEPLRSVIFRRYGPGYFDGVHGGHGAKVANLQAIMAFERLSAAEIAMIGDGIDDRDAARDVGCGFFGVAGGTLAVRPDCGPLLTDLGDLWPLLLPRLSRPAE